MPDYCLGTVHRAPAEARCRRTTDYDSQSLPDMQFLGSMIGQGRRHGFPTHSRTLEMADAEHTWLRQFYHEAAQRQVLMRIWIV
jgi:hypothetical protein